MPVWARVGIVLFIVATIVAFVLRGDEDKKAENDFQMAGPDDTEMVAAMEQARATLDEFRERLANPQPNDTKFGLKIRIHDGHHGETIWTNEVEVGDEFVTGTVYQQPRNLVHVKQGDRYMYPIENVCDWGYRDDGVAKGNYTLRVMLTRMPAEQAAQIRKDHGWEETE